GTGARPERHRLPQHRRHALRLRRDGMAAVRQQSGGIGGQARGGRGGAPALGAAGGRGRFRDPGICRVPAAARGSGDPDHRVPAPGNAGERATRGGEPDRTAAGGGTRVSAPPAATTDHQQVATSPLPATRGGPVSSSVSVPPSRSRAAKDVVGSARTRYSVAFSVEVSSENV